MLRRRLTPTVTGFAMCLILLIDSQHTALGQSNLFLSIPLVYSRTTIANNWSPPTAAGRQDYFKGYSWRSGFNLNYSFIPSFIPKTIDLRVCIGLGYVKQQFTIDRPFNYASPLEPVFYTDHYSYFCWEWSVGVAYYHSFNKQYFMSGILSYSGQHSFRQEYVPTTGDSPQVGYSQIDYGKLVVLSIGINRNLSDKFSLGFNVLVPLYTRWRNDVIFGDDPSEFSNPAVSIGTSASVIYRLRKANLH